MGDAQSAHRDGPEEEERDALQEQHQEQHQEQDGPSRDCSQDKLIQNNRQISDKNVKSDGKRTEVTEKITKEAITVKHKVTLFTKSKPEEVTNVQIIQEKLPDEEEPIEILNVDTKQNDINESFRKFFSNIGLKLTFRRGDNEGEKDGEKLVETTSNTKYEDVGENTDLNAIQDNDSTTCPTMTDGTPEDVVETAEETKMEDNKKDQEDEVYVSPIKRFFTTGIFAKKKMEEESMDEELFDISKNHVIEEKQKTEEPSPSVAKQEEIKCKNEPVQEVQAIETPEENRRGRSPSTDQESESELTSSQEKAQSSPFKRLFSGSFRRRSKKKRRKTDAKLSDSTEHIESKGVALVEKTEPLPPPAPPSPSPPPPSVPEPPPSVPEPPPPSVPEPPFVPEPQPPTTEPEEELSAWEAFKKLMTPKKSFKRPPEETQEPAEAAAVEETKPKEEERTSDHSVDEGRKRKDSAHSWEAVLCGSGRRRSRKSSDSEGDQREAEGGGQFESSNEAGDIVPSTPKQATPSPSDSESSTWRSFKKLLTPKRKVKEEEEIKDTAQSDSEATQEEALFSLRKLLPGRKKKLDQLSVDYEDRDVVSMEEDSETPAVVPLSEFDQSETEESAKTDTDIESKVESEEELVLEIPKTFVQEIQEHQVTPTVPSSEDQDELTEFSKYQPLSDIPEEGNITETNATSLIEEVVKDDTIADDMVEITSEAITAPEPVDITMADETDDIMLSAASHLPESSKTSGNATPVPAEYDVNYTDGLLEEVVENISTAVKAGTVRSEEPVFERVVSSVSHETKGRYAITKRDVMGIHAQLEAVCTETGLYVTRLQDTDIEIPASAHSESLSEFKDAISTQYVSEFSKVDFESAQTNVDELHFAHPEGPLKQESVDDSEYMIESISEVPESTDIMLQDQDVDQDVFTPECLEEETKVITTDSTKLLLEEKVEAIDVLEKAEIQDGPMPSEPTAEVDSVQEMCKEEQVVQEHVVESNAEIIQPGELVQPEDEERIDVQSLELDKEEIQELSQEQAQEELQEVAEISVEDETVAEEDFEIINKHDVEDAQEPILDPSNPQVQEEQCLALSGLGINAEITDDKNTEQPEQDVTDATTEQEGIEMEMIEVQHEEVVASDKLSEEAVEDKPIEGTVILADEEILEQKTEEVARMVTLQEGSADEGILEQKTEEVARKVTLQDGSAEVEEQTLAEAADSEIDDKMEVQETTEDQEQDMLPEVTDEHNGQVIASSGRRVSFKLDYPLVINREHTGAETSIAEVMQVDHSHEDTEDLGDSEEDLGFGQQLEESVDLEKSSELYLSTSEEPYQDEEHIGETEVNAEEEEIPCTETELANVEHEALPEESMTTSQQVTPTMPDLMIKKTMTDGENISEDPSILSVDNAEVLDEPKHDVQLIEVEEVGIQGEKEEEIVPPVTSNVEVLDEPQHDVQLSAVEEVGIQGEKEEEIVSPVTSNAEVLDEPQHDVQLTAVNEVGIQGEKEEGIVPPLTSKAEVLDEPNHDVQLTEVEEVGIQENKEEDIVPPVMSNTKALDEHDVQLTEVEEVGIQGEKEEEIVPPVTSNADVQHTFVTEMITCSFSDVASGIPDVTVETTTQMHELMAGTVASEGGHMEPIETTTPLEVNNVSLVAQEGKALILMHVPSVKFEDKHEIQVQVVDVDIQSAESGVDKAVESVVQEDKELVDTCHETVGKVDSVSAMSELEEEITSETDKVDIQDVAQFVKELAPESEEEPGDKEPPSDLVDELSEDQNTETYNEEDTVEAIKETKDEVLTNMHKEVKEVQKSPNGEDKVVTPSNTAVAVPQNTSIMSSTGNVETPSSLSLEFKLNIQFGHSRAPVLPSPPPPSERTLSSSPQPQSPTGPQVDRKESPKPTEMTEVGVQVMEEESRQENEQKTSETAEAAVQASETTEEPDIEETMEQAFTSVGLQSTETKAPLETEKVNSTETGETDNQQALTDVSLQSIQQEELSEKDKITDVECISAPTCDQVQSEKELMKKEVVLTELVVPMRQTEDEDENQDVWMDAEEDIDGQEEMPLCELEDSFESQPDYFEETKSDFEESFENIKKTTIKCDSEEEDFTAALADPQIATAIATMSN